MSKCPNFQAIIGQALGTKPPVSRIDDGLIAELVRRALTAEPAFSLCWVHSRPNDKRGLERAPMTVSGEIAIQVVSGAIMLHGKVSCLGQKRLAGALAWWVPGCSVVINALGLTAPENDSETAITDAVRLVLKKDPFVDSGQITVSTDKATVTLDGSVPTALAREIAENDAWYVYGVEEVVNRITVGR